MSPGSIPGLFFFFFNLLITFYWFFFLSFFKSGWRTSSGHSIFGYLSKVEWSERIQALDFRFSRSDVRDVVTEIGTSVTHLQFKPSQDHRVQREYRTGWTQKYWQYGMCSDSIINISCHHTSFTVLSSLFSFYCFSSVLWIRCCSAWATLALCLNTSYRTSTPITSTLPRHRWTELSSKVLNFVWLMHFDRVRSPSHWFSPGFVFIGNFTAFAIVLAELWKKEDDDDDSYSSSAVNPTALKSQVTFKKKKKFHSTFV